MKCFSELKPKTEAEKLLEAFENIRYVEEPINEEGGFLSKLFSMFKEVFGSSSKKYEEAKKKYDKYIDSTKKENVNEVISKVLEDKSIKKLLKDPNGETIKEIDKKIDEICEANNYDEDINGTAKLSFYLSLAQTYPDKKEFREALQKKLNDVISNNPDAKKIAEKIKKDADDNVDSESEENAPDEEEVEEIEDQAKKASRVLGGNNSNLKKFVDAFFTKIKGRGEGQDDGTYKMESKIQTNGYMITEAENWYNAPEIKPFRELLRNNKANLDEKELKKQRDVFINFVASVESFIGNIGAKGKSTGENENKWNFLIALLQNENFRDLLGYK